MLTSAATAPRLAGLRATLIALSFLPATQLVAQEDAPAAEAPTEAAKVVRVIEVGTVHTVSGPAIDNGVILIEDGRIAAVGKAGEVEVPDTAEILRYPDAHAYPGLVDALSTAFGDATVLADASSDAGTEILAGLNPHEQTSRSLISYGITTAYISNRGTGSWRGMGALVHPRSDGFEPMEHEQAKAAAVQMRVTGGPANTHPLARQKALRAVGKSFDQLEAYEKKKKDHEEALEKYEKDYAEYLEHFAKKNGKSGEEKDTEKGSDENAEETPRRGRGSGRRGRRRPPDGEEEPPVTEEEPEEKKEGKQEPEKKKPEAEEKKPTDAKSEEKGKEDKEKAPEKPKYPKAPAENPAQEALIAVRDGDLPLRVEARRADEIQATLQMRRKHEIPQLVLEVGTEAASLSQALADAGIPVVAADFLTPRGSEHNHDAALPGTLASAGVAVAIGSGSVRQARFLPLIAAVASGNGLDPDQAVSAITLTAAKILGVGSQVGSLDAGKRADVLITDLPLLASDARVLAVLSGGETQYEAR